MRLVVGASWFGFLVLTSVLGAQGGGGAASDCTKLKGRAWSACEVKSKADAAASSDGAGHKDGASKDVTGEMPTTGVPDPPGEAGTVKSKPGETRNAPGDGAGEMPTSGVPDPPAESMGPVRPSDAASPDAGGAPASSSSSSSSSSSKDSAGAGDDDDVAPTKAGGDTPVNASSLKDLGSRVDSGEARAKLEQTRVEDDLKVGGFYFKDGNYTGATARYQDALQRDPDNPDAHFGLAQVLLKQNKREEAVKHLRTYVKLAPDDDHTKEAQKLLAKLSPSP